MRTTPSNFVRTLRGARAYLPELGVFASVDPLRLTEPEQLVTAHPSASAYAYANNNPLTQVDRSGEFAWVPAAAVLIGVVVTSQYANAPESAEAPTQHKGWGEQLLDMAHNSVMVYGAMRLVGALPALARTVLAGDVGSALQTTATVAKTAATTEIVGQAADKVDPSGTTRKVVEVTRTLSMKSVQAPRPPPRAKPEPLKEYFKTLEGGDGVAGGGPKALPAPKVRGNPNPVGEQGTFYVDPKGNVIPTPPGGRIQGSPDGRFIQAKDAAGNPTGVRIDGPHNPAKHSDPRALAPHGHVPGVTNPDGTPWLPIK